MRFILNALCIFTIWWRSIQTFTHIVANSTSRVISTCLCGFYLRIRLGFVEDFASILSISLWGKTFSVTVIGSCKKKVGGFSSSLESYLTWIWSRSANGLWLVAFKDDILLHSLGGGGWHAQWVAWPWQEAQSNAKARHLTPHFHANGPVLRFTMWPICGGAVMVLGHSVHRGR